MEDSWAVRDMGLRKVVELASRQSEDGVLARGEAQVPNMRSAGSQDFLE